ncbi:teichoic acid biosynthesis protein C [Nocardiopsis sediminis]|uniref:Teichoic acid biosynthesis protein C n=1 Tax=Nocardiopsis sediminis TaxID=1778267 RepID=A0ABV8FYK9_9ACTN
MPPEFRHGPTRRSLLAAGGGLGVAAALGFTATPASADVPSSPRFDLSAPSHDLWRHKALQDDTVMQSFTFDNVNKRLFVAQLKNGSSSNANGDLCITQLDFAGNRQGHMYLMGFGHGVSIGVEPSGSSSYLWTETDSVDTRGTRLARFRFSNGTTLTNTSSALAKHTPIAGADLITCATDPVNNTLVMRYRNSSGVRYAVYRISDVRNGNYGNKLADIAQPARFSGSGAPTFQGYAVYGQFLYLYDGTAYSASNPPPGNAHVTSVNLNTGAEVERRFTRAGESLEFREPEGMGVYRTDAGQVRLFLGFASGVSGDRRANLFYKNEFI